MKKIITISLLSLAFLFLLRPTSIYALDSDSQVATTQVEEKNFYQQAVDFFTSGDWTALVGTISSGGLLTTLLIFLKKRKSNDTIVGVVSKMKDGVAKIDTKFTEIKGYVDKVSDTITDLATKFDVVVASLTIAVAGMPVKEEYKVELTKMLGEIKVVNGSLSCAITQAIDLATTIIDDKKAETAKEVIQVKNDINDSINRLIGE